MGTADGLSKHPYIRESRRIVALKTVVEQDVSAQFQAGPLAAPLRRFGRHRLVPDRHPSRRARRRRPQLPDEAVPDPAGRPDPGAPRQPDRRRQEHRHDALTNGCYRLHPVEWNIGEAAGALAAFALQHGVTPAAVRAGRLALFRQTLVDEGVPLAWPESLR